MPAGDDSVLWIGNHISWWDAFLIYEVNERQIHKQFYAMMLESRLKEYRWFRHLGAYSVQPGRKDILDSMAYTRSLLSGKNNLVLFFPEGKLHSAHTAQVHFQVGLSRLLAPGAPPFQIVFSVLLFDYFDRPRPRATLYTRLYKPDPDSLASAPEEAYNLFYAECRTRQSLETR